VRKVRPPSRKKPLPDKGRGGFLDTTTRLRSTLIETTGGNDPRRRGRNLSAEGIKDRKEKEPQPGSEEKKPPKNSCQKGGDSPDEEFGGESGPGVKIHEPSE